MTDIKKALEARSASKNRKPTYKRVQSHQFAKLKDTKWRKPKGMGNKVRRGRRGKPSMPEVGFGSPKLIKGANKKGLFDIVVSNVKDLEKIDIKTQSAVLSSTLGGRKKIDVLNKAKEMKIVVSNVKDVDSKIKSLTKVKKSTNKKVETKTETKSETKSETKPEETKSDGGKKE